MTWFNARTETAELTDFSPLPDGVYHMFVSEIDTKHDTAGNEYIGVCFEVLDEDHKGRKLFENLYLKSQYDGVANKGRALMKKLCEAASIEALYGPSDLRKFVGLEVEIKLSVYKNKQTGKERNIINGLRKHPTLPKAPDYPRHENVQW